jgi:hypothetical protein
MKHGVGSVGCGGDRLAIGAVAGRVIKNKHSGGVKEHETQTYFTQPGAGGFCTLAAVVRLQ